ncbi:MAG: C39 family peptidase [Roseburia sp.]|nr:C39 family peptidase [Roseburia sp.]
MGRSASGAARDEQYVRTDWGIGEAGTRSGQRGGQAKGQTVRTDWGIGEAGTHSGQRTDERRMREERMNERELRERRRRARERKRRRQRLFFLSQALILFLTICLAVVVVSEVKSIKADATAPALVQEDAQTNTSGGNQTANAPEDYMTDYASQCGVWEVAAPVNRETWEAVEKLKEYANESGTISAILEDTSRYPDEMLEALANNPEMTDFVAGYPEAEGSVTGGLSEREKSEAHPLFLQWDPRWGYASYGDGSNIGLAGCGPTSLAMAIYYLTKDETVTPDAIAKYSMENGYYMPGTGTAWILMEDAPARYGVAVDKPGISGDIMRAELDAGHVLICAMRAGDFTASGHFIVIYGYDETGFFVNDPNCVARSRESWSYERIGSQIKQLWSLKTA